MKDSVREFIGRQSQRLDIDLKKQGPVTIIRCRGAFSLVNHTYLDDLVGLIHTAEGKRIVIDLLEVQHIDSTGLGTLATAFKDSRSRSVELILVPSSEVRTAIAAVCLDKVFQLADNLEAASA